MKEKIKYIIIGLLVGFIAFPTVALGGTFISSLIQGKSVEESIQILAEQIDFLAGRITIVEGKLSKDELCQEANRLYTLLPAQQKDSTTGEWIGRIMAQNIVDLYRDTSDCAKSNKCGDARDLPIVEQYYNAYLDAKNKCEK